MSKKSLPSFVYTFTKKDAGGRWRGRAVRIFKRPARPFWYVQLVHAADGKQHRTVLKTEARSTAITLAIEVCDKVWSGMPVKEDVQDSTESRPTVKAVATVGEVLAVFPAVAVPAYQRERTATANANALRLVLSEVLGLDRALVGSVSLAQLSGDVWTRFEHGRLGRVPPEDRPARKSALESINTYATAARSIFQPKFVALYQAQHGLVIPECFRTGTSEFMTAALQQPKRVPKQKPGRDLLVKTFTAAVDLAWIEPEVHAAWLLAVYSLRRSEILRCERSWLRIEVLEDDVDFTAAGVPHWVIRTDAGKSDRERQIPIPEAVARELIAFWEGKVKRWPDQEQRYLIPRWVSYPWMKAREDSVVRRLSAWMRGLGWTTAKTLHEMRALFLRTARAQYGRQDEEGLKHAAGLAGHQSERTTENHYTGEMSMKGKIVEFPLLKRAG